MKFSYNWIKEYIVNLPNPKKVAEILNLKSFEVEKLEKIGNDYILDMKLLPDRFSDSSGHFGLAREIAAVLNLKLKEPKITVKEASEKTENYLRVKVDNQNDCPRYSARIMFDIKVEESPQWLKERLGVCGLQTINNIVDAANYVMLETGQPLHCFDYEKLAGKNIKTIAIRRAQNEETIETLDDKKYALTTDVLLIADLEKPLAIAGIKGGKSTGISEKTKRIAIESANFDPVLIRRASKSLNLITDASMRFERKVDPNLTESAINRLASLIQELTGGKIMKGIVDVYPKKIAKKALGFDFIKFERFAGVKIPPPQIKNIFERLHFKIVRQQKNNLILEIPSWRLDIERFEDLAEEILRIYDYNKIPEIPPTGILIPPQKNERLEWSRKIKKIIASLGLDEIYNYSFLSEKDLVNFGLNPNETIQVANPVSAAFEFLRPTLIINLLKTAASNFRFYDQVKIFELGKVFQKGAAAPYEEWRLAGLISRKNKKEHPFLEMKGILEKMFESLGFWDLNFSDLKENPWFDFGRSAEIKAGEESLGFIGEINQNLSQTYTDGYPAVIFEMDLEKIIKAVEEELEFEPIPKFPSIIRDLSILVNSDVRVSEILNVISYSETKLLRDADLFDMYEGTNLPSGKKSLSFHLIFQADDHTLTNDEIGKSLEKIISNLKSQLSAEIR